MKQYLRIIHDKVWPTGTQSSYSCMVKGCTRSRQRELQHGWRKGRGHPLLAEGLLWWPVLEGEVVLLKDLTSQIYQCPRRWYFTLAIQATINGLRSFLFKSIWSWEEKNNREERNSRGEGNGWCIWSKYIICVYKIINYLQIQNSLDVSAGQGARTHKHLL